MSRELTKKSPQIVRLAMKMAEHGLRQVDLEKISGVSAGHISKIMNGERLLNPRTAQRLAPHLGTTPEYLLTGVEHAPALREVGTAYALGEVYVIPVVGRAAADETEGALRELEQPMGTVHLSKDVAVVEVLGNSLSPLARPGQKLLLDGGGRTARNGDLVVLETTDDRVLAKRYFRDNDALTLTSINAGIAPVNLHIDDVRRLRVVIGVLFE